MIALEKRISVSLTHNYMNYANEMPFKASKLCLYVLKTKYLK